MLFQYSKPFKALLNIIVVLAFLFGPLESLHSAEPYIYKDPVSYVVQKMMDNDIVFLGTTHQKPAILRFINNIIPHLKESGITHVGIEMPTDHQGDLDAYLSTGTGLMDIYVHPQIDCPEYRKILETFHRLRPEGRPSVIALDLPKSMYKQTISRDEWMAQTIAARVNRNPVTKMLVIVGNFHVLKKLVWQDHVPNKTGSIREYLNRMIPDLKAFSIGQVIDEDPNECDFTKRFGPIQGAVAMDCTERFSDWKIGVTSAIAIKNTKTCQLFDGLIVY
jgi:hypothetical protein